MFWDSSAVVPLLVEEQESGWLLELVEGESAMLVWWGTTVECVSALSRLEREGGIERRAMAQALRRLRALQRAWHEVQPIEPVREAAARLLRVHDLRAADALQLAAAIVAGRGRPAEFTVVCLDARLAAACEREGFEVLPDDR